MIEILNSRELVLNVPNMRATVYGEDSITEVATDKKNYKLGETINIQNRIYKINNIIQDREDRFLLQEYPQNKTIFYLLPLLFKSRESIGYNDYLITCYCKKNNQLGLYLLYRYDIQEETMKEIEETLLSHKRYVESKYNPISKIMSYNFSLNEPERRIVKLFLEGKYSSFPEEYKRNLLKFYSNKGRAFKRELEYILNKDIKLRKRKEKELLAEIPHELDLDDKPELKLETI